MFKVERLKQPSVLVIAVIFLLASFIPILTRQKVKAYTLPLSREIKMSSSAAGATSVTYRVAWQASATYTVKGIVIDFCSTSPIIGDTCTKPTGFSVGTPTIANQSGISGFSASSANTNRTLLLTNATGSSLTASTTNVSFELTTATNPTSSNTTFYARIITYTNDTGADSPATYTDTSPGTSTEAGGVALSTADQITIQSKVQERITFCVYTSAANYTSCGSVSTTNPVVLGDTNGVLNPSLPSVSKTAKYNITTNASNGVTIRAKGSTLTSGSFTIDAIGSGSSSGASSSVGTEQFGLCTYRDTGGGTGGLTPDNNYDGDASGTTSTACSGTTAGQASGNDNSANFTFDTTTSNDNWSTTYGDTIATKTAGNFSTGILVFLGNISNTTEPGIYTTTLTFIATGNY